MANSTQYNNMFTVDIADLQVVAIGYFAIVSFRPLNKQCLTWFYDQVINLYVL